MKARFFALMALVLGLASCQTDMVDGVKVDANGEAAVTLQVGLPQEATRAAGQDSGIGAIGNIDLVNDYDIRYILEVYDDAGNLAKQRIVNREDVNTSTSFSIRLIPGRPYKFVVWADFIPQDQADTKDYHYNTADLKCIGLFGDQKLNDESRDAYTCAYRVENFNFASAISLELKRPFAKLRVVTTDMDHLYTQLVSAKVAYTSEIYTQFDAVASNVIANSLVSNVEKTVYYDSMSYDESLNKTLFADYFFGAEDDAAKFTLDVKDNTNYPIPQLTFNTNIPVQRNYLTTVQGPILTDANNITVTINENFDGNNEWANTNADNLEYAAMFGGEVTLKTHMTLEQGLTIAKPMTINLNGYQLKYTGNDVLFRFSENASLVINGNNKAGSMIITNPNTPTANGGNGYIALVKDGQSVTFNGGTYHVKKACTIAQASGGKIYVKDGTFQAQEYEVNGVKDHRYTFNHSDDKKEVGLIEITGGKFYKYNPAESHSENPAMSFIPEGYGSYVINADNFEVKHYTKAVYSSNYEPLVRSIFRYGGTIDFLEKTSGTDFVITSALIAETNDVTIKGYGELGVSGSSLYVPGEVSAAICAKNGVTVTFDGYYGTLDAGSEDYAIEVRDGGRIVVKNGNGNTQFKGAVSAAYAHEGTVEIYAGQFYANESSYGSTYLLNCADANYTNGTAKILVMGGTYYGFNPANNEAEGPETNFLANGYRSVQTSNGSGNWKVQK